MDNPRLHYTESYSVTEWENWNDPWELIHGFPYCMSPSPSIRHQMVNTTILVELTSQLRPCKNCKAIMPIDWQIDFQTIVIPDILVICQPATGQRLTFPPTAIFEILSPSTEKKDRFVKFDLYQSQGVTWYILVDIATEKVEVY